MRSSGAIPSSSRAPSPAGWCWEVWQQFGSASVERIAALQASGSAVGARALARNASFDEARSHVLMLEKEHRRVRAAIDAQRSREPRSPASG